MIQVKRLKDGKIFTNDMTEKESIYEIHFCTSYTQVLVQEEDPYGNLKRKDIICPAIGIVPTWEDLLSIRFNDEGVFL